MATMIHILQRERKPSASYIRFNISQKTEREKRLGKEKKSKIMGLLRGTLMASCTDGLSKEIQIILYLPQETILCCSSWPCYFWKKSRKPMATYNPTIYSSRHGIKAIEATLRSVSASQSWWPLRNWGCRETEGSPVALFWKQWTRWMDAIIKARFSQR